MKYALVSGQREEARPDLLGECPCCNRAVVAKCGKIKEWHWAHRGKRICDPWWENETEWHRSWKANFPKEWQEVIHQSEGGEKHIADVKTDQGYVIEFQHSHINPVERHARENFYKKMIWIVDGNRRSRDKEKFLDGWTFSNRIGGRDDLRESPGGGALLRDWGAPTVTVLFDFGETVLWGLLPKTPEGKEYGFRVERKALVDSFCPSLGSNLDFDGLVRNLTGPIHAHEWHLKKMRERSNDPLMGLRFRQTGHSSHRRYK